MILAFQALAMTTTRNTRVKTFAIFLITACLTAPTSRFIDSPLLFISTTNPTYLLIHMRVKAMRIFLQHELDCLFSLILVLGSVMTIFTLTVFRAITMVFEAFAI